jgi:uncharacterized membrane protein HdeD (DUF308 family)
MVHAARASRRDRTWLILSGLGALVAGIVVVALPAITVTALVSIPGQIDHEARRII